MYVTIHSARTHMWTLLTYANDWNLKVNFPYLCFDWAEVTFLSCTHITSDQSKRRCKGKATLWPVPCTAPCQCHCTIIQYVPNKVYHDSEPQCVVGRQMGQLAMQCMLIVLLFSCKSRTHIPYIFVWVQQRPLLIFCYNGDKPYDIIVLYYTRTISVSIAWQNRNSSKHHI